jgi:signal transduction histidine kinase
MAEREEAATRDYEELQVGLEDADAGEPFLRWLPAGRVYGFLVLAFAFMAAEPWTNADGWRGIAVVTIIAALAVAFLVMWVYRPIWEHGVRTLAWHGLFQVVMYAAAVAVSPALVILQLLVYPQVVFSLPLRWSIAGGMAIGTITALVVLAGAGWAVGPAVAGMAASLLTAGMVVSIAVWIRETITQSMERKDLLAQIKSTRLELAAAERAAGISEERTRLAREIHDTLAQGFTSVVTLLQAADASLPADLERPRRHIRAAEDVARASLAEARTLVWALRPDAIATAGLPAAIERVAGSMAAGHAGPVIEVAVSGEARQLHVDVEVSLLRTAQEAVANAIRHAAASRITVTLTYYPDEVSLDVTDDGRGFDPSTAGQAGGLGLVGMRERAVGLGGRMAIESAPGDGTAISVTLPAIEAAAQ